MVSRQTADGLTRANVDRRGGTIQLEQQVEVLPAWQDLPHLASAQQSDIAPGGPANREIARRQSGGCDRYGATQLRVEPAAKQAIQVEGPISCPLPQPELSKHRPLICSQTLGHAPTPLIFLTQL